MKHEGVVKPHNICTISPNIASNKFGKRIVKQQLTSFKKEGFTEEKSQNCWVITQEGIEYVKKYFKKEEEL